MEESNSSGMNMSDDNLHELEIELIAKDSVVPPAVIGSLFDMK